MLHYQIVDIFIDVFVIALGCLGILLYRLFSDNVVSQRGFFCDDESLKYPFKKATITSLAVNLYSVITPNIVIILNEYYEHLKRRHNNANTKFKLGSYTIPLFFARLYRILGALAFGACFSQLTVNVTKITVGRLRPNFFAVCKPNIDCRLEDPHTYITNYTCLSDDLFNVCESRHSFPSGHASGSAFSMLYLVFYLQMCMNNLRGKLLKPFIQFLFLLSAWVISLTRYMDNVHHWEDIAVGMLIGTLTAIFTAVLLSGMFFKPANNDDHEDGSEEEFRKIKRPSRTDYKSIDFVNDS